MTIAGRNQDVERPTVYLLIDGTFSYRWNAERGSHHGSRRILCHARALSLCTVAHEFPVWDGPLAFRGFRHICSLVYCPRQFFRQCS